MRLWILEKTSPYIRVNTALAPVRPLSNNKCTETNLAYIRNTDTLLAIKKKSAVSPKDCEANLDGSKSAVGNPTVKGANGGPWSPLRRCFHRQVAKMAAHSNIMLRLQVLPQKCSVWTLSLTHLLINLRRDNGAMNKTCNGS